MGKDSLTKGQGLFLVGVALQRALRAVIELSVMKLLKWL